MQSLSKREHSPTCLAEKQLLLVSAAAFHLPRFAETGLLCRVCSSCRPKLAFFRAERDKEPCCLLSVQRWKDHCSALFILPQINTRPSQATTMAFLIDHNSASHCFPNLEHFS